jgi:hypothetical protein
MTAADFAERLDGRRTGRDKWQARCPGSMHARGDRDPSLSIALGRDGLVLLLCRVGCDTRDVLAAMGLSWRDLFAGPPPTPEQARQASLERERRDAETRQARRDCSALADRYRKLEDVRDALARRLILAPDDAPAGDGMTRLFHDVLGKLRAIEAVFEAEEQRGFYERLLRLSAKQPNRQRVEAA